MCKIMKENNANDQPFDPAQAQNGQPLNPAQTGQPFNPAQNGQPVFGAPQSYPVQQQPAYGNQPVQYGSVPVQGQYQK